ncbi:MAG TPA: hypothetical protein VN448_06080 [Gammaproteobacteria bacterium]|jgi:hypothetical protein|nr:hypothetical protein [Gammaproteobacteria bacterium]
MRGFVPPDPETGVSDVRYAVIFTPRQNRTRFPAGNVEIFESLDAARTAADPAGNRHAAVVIGPSKSSEGQFIFYLQRWL